MVIVRTSVDIGNATTNAAGPDQVLVYADNLALLTHPEFSPTAMRADQTCSDLQLLVDSRRSPQGRSVSTQLKGRSLMCDEHTETFEMLLSGSQFDESIDREGRQQCLWIIEQVWGDGPDAAVDR